MASYHTSTNSKGIEFEVDRRRTYSYRCPQGVELNLKPTNAPDDSLSTPWWKAVFNGNLGGSANAKNKPSQGRPKSITIEEDGTVTVPPPTDYNVDPDLLQNRPWTQRAVVLAGGVGRIQYLTGVHALLWRNGCRTRNAEAREEEEDEEAAEKDVGDRRTEDVSGLK